MAGGGGARLLWRGRSSSKLELQQMSPVLSVMWGGGGESQTGGDDHLQALLAMSTAASSVHSQTPTVVSAAG